MADRLPLFDNQTSVIETYFEDGLVGVRLLRKDRNTDELIEFKLTHQATMNLRKKLRQADEIITKGSGPKKKVVF